MSNGDWGTPPGGEDGGGSLLGQTLYDLEGKPLGRLAQSSGGGLYLVTGKGTTQKWIPFKAGTYLLDVGLGKARSATVDAAGNVVFTSTGELGGAGGDGAAAPQWRPGELDLERQRLQADIDATKQRLEEIRMQEAAADERQKRQLQAEREMLEMRLENSRRELLYSEYGATKRTLLQQKQSAREMKFQTREDPFALAQAMGAFPMIGGTPAQAFRGELEAFANAPIPQMNMNMPIPQMEQIIGGMGGMQMPMPGPYVGMAQGGVIEMEKGDDDIFRARPKMSWLVGEGKHGEGLAMGTAEILTVGDGKVEVTPFMGGRALGGSLEPPTNLGPFFPPTAPSSYSPAAVNPFAMRAMLAPLFADISPGGFPLAGVGQRASWLSRFGYQPSFVRTRPGTAGGIMSGGAAEPYQYFLRSPEGTYREINPYYITGPGAGRYPNMPTLESAATLRGLQEIEGLGGFGRPISSTALSLGYLDEFMKPKPIGAFGPMSGLISEPTTGIMMPVPYQVAHELNQIRRDNPTFFEGILSAYANAYVGGQPTGFGREAVLGQMAAATPQARYAGYTPQRIGWTGAQY